MVVFTCGHCGESVQKPKVEKHYLTKCRNRNPNLSCMDCFKDFLGNAYESHTKCVTEEERYSGKGFQSKEKKGEKKQNAWVEMLQSVLEEQKSAPSNVLRIIETITTHNNTPRKKPKFINFVKNVCGQKTNPKDIDQAWDLISVKLSALSNANQNKPTPEKSHIENNKTDNTDNGHDNSLNEANQEDTVNNDQGDEETETVDANHNGEPENVNGKKLSKKQRKEEKKRRKYEAELQSAEKQPSDDEDKPEETSKKGKKKKNKSESHDDLIEESVDSKKIKKRKRQDTTNSVPELPDNNDNVENIPVAKEKAQKKKIKVDGNEEADESICLHDQNVAKIEELTMQSDKFNWHAVIMSVLEKKGNELPFKRLQKKVLMEYSETTGREVDDRIAEKFIKKLKSAPKVRVDKNRVYIED